MIFNIVISPLAAKEIKGSISYYNSKKSELGHEFLLYFKGYIAILKTNPGLYPIKRKTIIEKSL